MAVEVVDHLQVIEVEKDDAEQRSITARTFDLFFQIAIEKSAIERFGEIVAHRQITTATELVDVAEHRCNGTEVAGNALDEGGIERVGGAVRRADHADEIV